jgi:hypothetical protein
MLRKREGFEIATNLADALKARVGSLWHWRAFVGRGTFSAMMVVEAGKLTNHSTLIISNGMGGQSLPEEIAENVTAKVGFNFGLKETRDASTDSRWREYTI